MVSALYYGARAFGTWSSGNNCQAFVQAQGRLREAEEAAAQGHHQFLSGLLHNLAKALSYDKSQPSPETQLRAIGLTPGLYIMLHFSYQILLRARSLPKEFSFGAI